MTFAGKKHLVFVPTLKACLIRKKSRTAEREKGDERKERRKNESNFVYVLDYQRSCQSDGKGERERERNREPQ